MARPRSKAIEFAAGVHLTISASIIIFGIGVPPIWQGVVGVCSALEGHFGLMELSLKRIEIFMTGLILNATLGIVLGWVAIRQQTYAECTSQFEGVAVRREQNFTFTFDGVVQDCKTSYKMYAYVEFGTAVMSITCFLIALFGYFSLRRGERQRSRDAEVFLFTRD